ncbi:Gfo/Idh/MocA family oxidoreductase [Halobacteria archaeon AArc-m2/3/4]|uniref:Gfo/Idh/MocA family oxidoreductase n=1 Tax=Natronoglomus mannanivorans TaxID=2979990 RepID=A0ABT2QKP7_9EURY|nr:Gfo/Idh/MocA family oxidoreductase [Halobacteria archaeon AArc-m2/3/4]
MVDPNYDYAAEYGDYDQHTIGIVGCGEIVESAHLPAYADAGFSVAGVTDVDDERAQAVADEFDLEVFPDIETLADSVNVVDVAVPPMFQREIVETVVDAGCHVLCQKPLAMDFEDASAIRTAVEDAGVIAAVNQQMRWEKSIRAVKDLLGEGALGTPLRATLEVNIETDFSNWGWMEETDHLEVMFHSIHYLDALRYLFGEPAGVSSTMATAPGQASIGETRTLHVLTYGNDLRATIDVNHNNWADPYARFRFEGTDGAVRGSIGLFDYYPESGPDTFEYLERSRDKWESHEVPDAWFPDAFIGTMGSLLRGIETGDTPPTHLADNIETLRLANATYKSWNEGRTVDPATIESTHEPEL